MGASRRPATKKKIRLVIRARQLARENATVVSLLAIIVAVAVTGLFMRRVLASKHQVRVLDCPVTHAVAHHHNESCYDDQGELVCQLPERDIHVHDEGCYERRLTCQFEESDAHYHDESCFDAEGNLTCGKEEGEGHQHDESCYGEVLVCAQDEIVEEHVHSDGCFRMIAANEDAPEVARPAQAFSHDVLNEDKELQMRIEVQAPMGALPKDSTMEAELLDPQTIDSELLQKAVDERAEEREVAREDNVEHGRVLRWQGVDVRFRDANGVEVEPAKDVTIRLTSELIATKDAHTIVSVEDGSAKSTEKEDVALEQSEATQQAVLTSAADEKDAKGDEGRKEAKTNQAETKENEDRKEAEADQADAKEGAADEKAAADDKAQEKAEPEAEVVDPLSEAELKEHKMTLGEDQLAFEGDTSAAYVLTTTSLRHEMEATDGSSVSILVTAPTEAGIPQDALLDVKRVAADAPEYDEYVARTVEAMGAKQEDVALASFFDIKIVDQDGNEFQPTAPVDVQIELADIPEAPNGFAAVHFHEVPAGDGDATTTELEQLACGGENGTIIFSADSFSVYGVIYTVDFGYEVDGTLYEYTLTGGAPVGLSELVDALHIYEGGGKPYESAAAFMGEVVDASFSDPSLIWLQSVSGKTTLQQILEEYDLQPQYSDEVTEEQKAAWGSATYENDWVLVSLQPFDTTEMLVITMADGTERFVAITDAQNAPMKPDGSGEVDTIVNPSGTKIDVFDYWITDANGGDSLRFSQKQNGWYGWNGGPDLNNQGANNNIFLKGSGNNNGINAGHFLKFEPANGMTVLDGPLVNGQQGYRNITAITQGPEHPDQGDGSGGVNSYTGNADPLVGLVENTLVGGYPQLISPNASDSDVAQRATNLGVDGESLAYLFDPDVDHAGKASYTGADHLLYVDEYGFYNYDSADYWAAFDRDTKEFTLTPQTADPGDDNGWTRGFWPFGDRVFWHGMHMNTEFSIPKDGKVLNPQGVYNDMIFEFKGDDDTWLYIDGVLVGDGGGIHNRTHIIINYATGDVEVNGTDDPDNYYPREPTGHAGQYSSTKTLLELFQEAGAPLDDFIIDVNGDGKINDDDKDGSGNYTYGDTFRSGTYHTFDMFYLERGGGQSNLKIRYNLVSTADFTAHKEYQGTNADETLKRNQFKFDLIGLDGEYYFDANDGYALKPNPYYEDRRAIMPEDGVNGAGTVESPLLIPNVDVELGHGQLYRTGSTEDGNVNFGTAVIESVLEGQYERATGVPPETVPVYRYMIRESIPDDAVNQFGQTYASRTDEQRKFDKWYIKDNMYYDAGIYYMTGAVTSWTTRLADGSTRKDYGLSKRYFTDATFTQQDSKIAFINFDNRYVDPLTLNVHKVDETSGDSLRGAKFKLAHAYIDEQTYEIGETPGGISQVETTDNDGNVTFANLPQGFYFLEETHAPVGYKLPDYKWLVVITRKDMVELEDGTHVWEESYTGDSSLVVRKYSELEAAMQKVELDGSLIDGEYLEPVPLSGLTFSKEIENTLTPPFEFDVQKQWEGLDLTDPDDVDAIEGSEIAVTLGRYTLNDIAGTLTITKSGVPAGAHVTATYRVVDRHGNLMATLSNDQWDGSEVEVGSVSLPPGEYTVEEHIGPDDDRYTHTHAGSPQTVTIQDEEDDPDGETAAFTSEYTAIPGQLTITSTLIDGTNGQATIDTSGVSYIIKDVDGNAVGQVSYDQAKDGYTVDVPLIGEYTVTETGWPDMSSQGCTLIHDPENQVCTATVTEDAPGQATFETECKEGVLVRVYEYKISYNENAGTTTYNVDDAIKTVEMFVSTPYVQLSFTGQPQMTAWNTNNHTLDILNVGTASDIDCYDSYIVWESTEGDNNYRDQTGTVTIPIPVNTTGSFNIFLGRGWKGPGDNDYIEPALGEYAPPSGDLTVTATMTDERADQTQPISTSGVKCVVYDASGTPVAECDYADAQSGHTFHNLAEGNYTVKTTGWDDLSGTCQFVDSVSPSPVTVVQNTTASCTIATTCKDPSSEVVIRVIWNNYGNNTVLASGSVDAGNSHVRVTCNLNYNASIIAGTTAGSNDLIINVGGNAATIEGALSPSGDPPEFIIYVRCDDAGVFLRDSFTFTSYTPRSGVSSSGRSVLSASPKSQQTTAVSDEVPTIVPLEVVTKAAPTVLRGNIEPGTDTQTSSDSGDRPTPHQHDKKYVIDGGFSRTVTLTKDDSNWTETVSDLPAYDQDGNRYYYFIESINETGLPAGTTARIVKETDGTKVLAYQNETFATPETLTVVNDVGQPADVTLNKVDSISGASVGGATFHVIAVEGQSETRITSPTVIAVDPNATVSTDANGVFNVPELGATVQGLEPGSYKFVEDAPPAGYIMTGQTEFPFTVNSDGTVTSAYNQAGTLTLEIPNTPGEELPMSGGPGTAASTVAGVSLAAAGALILLRNRRRAAQAGEGH